MNGRLKTFLLVNFLLVLIWVVYLFSVQVLDPHNLKRTVELRRNPTKKITLPNRGNIYDRKGELLVSTAKIYQIDIDRSALRNYCTRNPNTNLTVFYKSIAEIIADNTTLKKSKILKILNTKSTPPVVFISDDITESQYLKINRQFKDKIIPGLVKSFRQLERVYPQGKLAGSLLGLVRKTDLGSSPGSLINIEGKNGLEATFNEDLTGVYGWEESIYDAQNKMIPLLFLKEKPAKNGNSIYLTIDKELQEILEENLLKVMLQNKAQNAIGLIMDPFSGEILAMSGMNSKFNDLDPSTIRASRNLPVSFIFEPGSTFKPIAALLALENRIFDPDDIVDCRDYEILYKSKKRKITDAHEFDELNFRDIIAYSSNVGISKIVEEIGSEKLYERMIELGFGQKTGSGISGEVGGILRKLNEWQGFSLHSISFGQEVGVTALQLTNAYCTLINGGKVLRPYIIKEIKSPENKTLESSKPRVLRSISNQRSLDTLKVFFKSVVDYGTGVATKMEVMNIGGKTGTAEKIIAGEGSYSKDKFTSIFVGFFPVDHPQYVISIIFDEPAYEYHYASASAVPVFKNIVTAIINQIDCDLIVEEKERNRDYIKMPDLMDKTKKKAISILQKKNISYTLIEKKTGASVFNQYPKPGVKFDRWEKVILILDTENESEKEDITDFKMPDLTGLTVRKAINEAIVKNLRINIKGKGIVTSQSISPGKKIKYGEKCILTAK